MTEDEYLSAREMFLADGSVDERLWGVLQKVASRLVRFGRLPPFYSPYGVWNREAEEDAHQDWVTSRLVAKGHVGLLLQRAGDLDYFQRLAERSFRQHLINRRERSQSQNVYRRMRRLLDDNRAFEVVVPAQREQDICWGLRQWREAATFTGSDSELLAAAWSLGDFELVRYQPGAGKLSPVVSNPELRRFVHGLLDAVGEAVSLSRMLRVFETRFALAPAEMAELDEEQPHPASDGVEQIVQLRDLALSALGELTSRQADVLLATDQERPMEAIAQDLGCSVGTVHNEQRRIGELLRRLGGEDEVELLKAVRDLLYEVDAL